MLDSKKSLQQQIKKKKEAEVFRKIWNSISDN